MLKLNTDCSVCKDKTNTINDKNQKAFDNLVYKKNSKLTIDINDDDVSITINSNKPIKFKKESELGSGVLGTVFKLTSAEPEGSPYHNIAAALKIEMNKVATEQEISEFLLENDCNTLKVKYIETDKNQNNLHYYIMELANGDLTNLKYFYKEHCGNTPGVYTLETLKLYRDIVEEIRKQVACLLLKSNYQYVYNDLKFGNILFSCSKDNTNIKVMLGDLGSAYNKDEVFFTYLPIEYFDKEFKKFINRNNDEKKKSLSWLIGILFCLYGDITKNLLPYKNSKTLEDAKYYNKLLINEINSIFGEEFSAYLNINPKKRPDIFKELPDIKMQKSRNQIIPKTNKKKVNFLPQESKSSPEENSDKHQQTVNLDEESESSSEESDDEPLQQKVNFLPQESESSSEESDDEPLQQKVNFLPQESKSSPEENSDKHQQTVNLDEESDDEPLQQKVFKKPCKENKSTKRSRKSVRKVSKKPSKEYQVRNKSTKRSRKSVRKVSRKPCKEGQVRNRSTKRCRKSVRKVSRKPCKEGQVRNRSTKRCRKSVRKVSRKDCKQGQVRNRSTKRCRNSKSK